MQSDEGNNKKQRLNRKSDGTYNILLLLSILILMLI